MAPAHLMVLLVGSIDLFFEAPRGVTEEDLAAIQTGLQTAVSEQTAREAQVVAALQETADDVVVVQLIGVPTRIRLSAERRGGDETSTEIDLSRSQGSWAIALAGVAAALFPEGRPEPPPPQIVVAPPPPPPPAAFRYEPWLVVGGGVLAGAVGVGFGVSSRGARSSAANEPHTDAELASLEDRAVGHGIAANVLFAAGGAAVVGGLIWWLLGE